MTSPAQLPSHVADKLSFDNMLSCALPTPSREKSTFAFGSRRGSRESGSTLDEEEAVELDLTAFGKVPG